MNGQSIRSKLRLRSELTQEILSHKPSFVEKWALHLFLGILFLLISASWFIRYPDIITARATLTTIDGPKEIIPRASGRLVKLFVGNGDVIHKDQVIAWIENPGDHNQVLELAKLLDSAMVCLNAGHEDNFSNLFNRRYNNLGEVQQGYQQFIASWQQFNDYMVNGFYLGKKNRVLHDMQTLENTRKTIEVQKKLNDQDIKIAEETYKMNKELADEKILSKEEFRAAESKFLNKQMSIQQLDASLLANEAQKSEKLKELDLLDHNFSQQRVVFRQALTSLKSLVDDWKIKYVLSSPIDGKAFFSIPIQESRFVTQGGLLGYIVPDDSRYYIEANIGQNNFGKIDTGMAVQLRFDAYPYQEMGFVRGTLNYVSSIASDSGILATIRLDNGLVTNSRRTLTYKNGLKANALVITKNIRLLQRLYYNMTKFTSADNKKP
jgi:HlyD family secretion protein